MKKRLLVLMLAFVLITSSMFTAFADAAKTIPAITIDGKAIDFTNHGVYRDDNGTEIYPLRLVSESLSAKVNWDDTKKCAQILTSTDDIWLNPTENTVTKNGVEKKLPYKIQNIDNRLYIPASFITEIIGARLELDKINGNVNIYRFANSLEAAELTDAEESIMEVLIPYLTSLELNRNFSGQILVEKNGKVLLDRSYGYADYENKVRAFNNTTFAIGSVTKQIVAAAIVQLAEENKLSLDDKLSEYISDVPFSDQITLHQMLTHTSGLHSYTNVLFTIEDLKPEDMTFEKLISMIADKPLDFEPGTSWSYSNTGYLILGEIVEIVSGKSLISYLEENIFKPAGMENTGVAYVDGKKQVEANGYNGNIEVKLDTADEILLNAAYGAGYLHSTTEDLYKWDEALLAGKIVSKEGLLKLFGKHPSMKLLVPYGYGWFVQNGEFGEEISHGGNTIGFTSDNAIFTDSKTKIIILVNKGYTDLQSIKKPVLSILNGEKIAPLEELKYITISEDIIKGYEGNYEIKDMLKLAIFVKDGKLMMQGENQPAISLDPVSETKFESTSFSLAIEFDNKENPKSFILYQLGYEFKAERQ